MWCRAVWQEDKHEEKGVVPSHWIEENVVRWPKVSNSSKFMKERSRPSHSWWKCPLVKVKFASGMHFVVFLWLLYLDGWLCEHAPDVCWPELLQAIISTMMKLHCMLAGSDSCPVIKLVSGSVTLLSDLTYSNYLIFFTKGSEWVSEQFLNGTSAQYRLYRAIQIKSWEKIRARY